MTPEELWRTTPRDFRVMVEAKIEQRDQDWKFYDVLNGQACSTLVNLHLKENAAPYKPVDFMITRREISNKETDPMKQAERIYEQFHSLSLMTGGGKR